jgi:hypothetical protein
MEKRNNPPKKVYFVLIISAILIISVILIINSIKVLDKKIIPISVEVGEYLGLNAGSEELNFGTLIPGQASTKKLVISNGYSKDVKIMILLDKGNITKYIYGISLMNLSPGESIEYEVKLVLPDDLPLGNYEGNLILEFSK